MAAPSSDKIAQGSFNIANDIAEVRTRASSLPSPAHSPPFTATHRRRIPPPLRLARRPTRSSVTMPRCRRTSSGLARGSRTRITSRRSASRPSPSSRWCASGPLDSPRSRRATDVLLLQVMHARSGGQYEIMGLMQGKLDGDTFVVMDAFALPVVGTETRVNAANEANEFMIQYIESSPAVRVPPRRLLHTLSLTARWAICADWPPGEHCRLVPLAPGLRLLALWYRRHDAEDESAVPGPVPRRRGAFSPPFTPLPTASSPRAPMLTSLLRADRPEPHRLGGQGRDRRVPHLS